MKFIALILGSVKATGSSKTPYEQMYSDQFRRVE